jgi:peptidyl-prolyl cis-trans isomerase C
MVCLKVREKGLFLLFFMLVFFTGIPSSEGLDEPVAKVNNTVLTEADLQEEMNKIIPSITIHGGVSPERLAKYRPKAVEKLIENELLYQGAVEMGLKADDDRIKSALKEVMNKVGGKKRFKNALKVRGLTIKHYEKMLERVFLIDMIVKQEITRKAVVTEEEARRYYERNKEGYVRPEARRLSHILISVSPNALQEDKEKKRKRAEEAREKAVQGADFGTLAWDYSDDPYKYKGGELGLVHKGRLDPALEEDVLKLKEGEISEVLASIYGYHIFKVTEINEPVQLEFMDVSQRITRELSERKAENFREELLSRLREKADIEIYQ